MTCLPPTYEFFVGETMVIPITASEAAEGDEASIVGRMKALTGNSLEITPGTPITTTFETQFRAATEDFAKGWNFIAEAVSAGRYSFNFASTTDSIWKSDPAIIVIRESAA